MFPAVRIAPVLLSASFLACAASGAAWAQDGAPSLNGYVTLANGYWNRGLAQNDGLSLQLGIDYQQKRGWFVGGWAANVDYASDQVLAKPREIESEVYGGYHRRNEDWSWTMMLGRYYYPDTSISYDWNELSATVGFRDRVYYTAAYTDQFYGRSYSALNQEISFALPLRGNFEIGGTLGHFELAAADIDYTHWNLGVSKIVRRVVIDLRYYKSGYDYASWLGDPNGTQYVLSVSYALRGGKPRI
jgi:uncharacterized protein (TIGR02001 family)